MSLKKIKETIFAYDKEVIDCEILRAKNIDIINSSIYLCGVKLQGSQELPNHPFFFGELDKEGNIKQEQPSYYFAPKDETLDKGKLTIYLHNLTLTLLNYSLSNESLKIKLKLTHKENIKTLEQTRLTLNQNKALEIKAKQSKASLYAVLEDDVIRCPHGGKVILKSNKGKSFKSNGVPLILESDYLNSKIQGCSHTIAGVSVPCTRVVNVKGSLSQKKVNDEFVILQELVSNSITNQGFALKCVPKLNQFIFDHSFNPLEGLEQQSKSLTKLQEPMIRLHYKSDRFQKDNLPIYRFSLNDNPRQENEPLTQLNLEKEILEIKDKEQENSQNTLTLLESLKNEFKKEMLFKQIKLKIDTNLIYIYFIIPQSIPKIYKEAYENYKDKDYGIGEFKQLHSYTNIKALKLSQEEVKDKMPNYTEYIFAFMTPYKAKKIKFEFALGIDECIRKEDEKEKKRVSEIVVVNGGFDVDW
ncbi:hypothetical protein [Campylobacter helveticus]|uniref:hypothetical protein n=3 Tax=Campylobacter helveticus TaxID=28898 RepID=UPI001043F134|nr:hypothetical protein [Campylobacter helveticus]QBL11580.1 hypothetical protein A0073_03335 [Campylobacter helveticus]QBL11603.1 hypothetical protein A0073_03530 [Campylobacter helveticus]